ncbi:MAG: hypothetical protein JRH20_10785, partial [Deltaproteobacteria bacterium]|nr:hypothetical protein [Deltaproteobacteria bacterium]
MRAALFALLGLVAIPVHLHAAPQHIISASTSTGSKTPEHERLLVRLKLMGKTAKPEAARVVWLVGDVDDTQATRALGCARRGATVIWLPGRERTQVVAIASRLGLSVGHTQKGRVTLETLPSTPRALRENVIWSSAPQAGVRYALEPPAGAGVLLRAKDAGPNIMRVALGEGAVIVFALQLEDPSNHDFILWPYFNYMLYSLAAAEAKQGELAFSEWQHSPVPKRASLGWIALLILFGWIVTLLLFFQARRYSRAHPEILETFFPKEATENTSERANKGAWKQVGFARPLAGFLTLVGALFFLFVPYYWVTNVLLPNDVQPFPQARGMWDFVAEALMVVWFLFDAGTFVAFVKYFSEYRHKDPKEALRSAQFFVWWQILTGLVQVSMAVLFAVLILPNTRYGYMSHLVILMALGQYPGFFGVVTFFFQAYQRFDYNIWLDLLSDWVLRFALMIPFVLLFRRWGAANPEYGEAFGAAVGMGVGFYVSTVMGFFIGVFLYKRLGFRMLPLFLAHFDKATAKRMLWYGARVVLGRFFYRAAQTADKAIISLLLLNYTEWLGLAGQIHYNLMFLFPIAYRFFETAMAAFSEAYGNDKKVLTQYYVARFFQVGSLYAAIGMSLLFALGPLFVTQVMDPQWARAANYLIIAAAMGAFFAPAWLSDMLQKGAGRPGLFALVLGGEQLLRIGLFFVMIPQWGFTGYYLTLLITIMLKVVVAWTLNHRLIVRLKIYSWQMFVAPLLAGLANYVLWRLVVALWGPQEALTVTMLFFAASLAS